jgi:hypothetical protein
VDESAASGRHARCRECCNRRLRDWGAANADAVERYRFARGVGLHEFVSANPECGKTFTARKGNARTCGKVCRDRLRYLRRTGADVPG